MENVLRKQITDRVLQSRKHNIILEVATGTGKTKIALDKLDSLAGPFSKILIVVPRLVLIQTWKDEFVKWSYQSILPNVTFVTYVSLFKVAGQWDVVIYDECHHLSERCREALKEFTIGYSIYLSATVRQEVIDWIYSTHKGNIDRVIVSTRKAIKENILPMPKIILIPLYLDNKEYTETYYPKKAWKEIKGISSYPYQDKWKAKRKGQPYSLLCTKRQYYNEVSAMIDWFKQRNDSPIMRNMWLHACGERLKWLAKVKLPIVKKIMNLIDGRYIVFCNTIEDSERLGIPSVNSETGTEDLDRFNNGQIDAISAVNCLNEGVNLSNCQTGIFDAINSSSLMQIQKTGRLLRHKKPCILIPFYRNTREEEIVEKWMEGYDSSLITTMEGIIGRKEKIKI